jgi:dTDP-4-dehydrorhamnose 3,5-epimerase
MIEDLILTPLPIVKVEGGDVMHAIKYKDEGVHGFGEVYFSNVDHGFIKAWKRHHKMILNIVVPIGEIRFVIFDDRKESSSYGEFQQVTLSQDNYQRLTVPSMVWMGFQGIGKKVNLLMNFANILHDPTESDRKKIDQINYKWRINK